VTEHVIERFMSLYLVGGHTAAAVEAYRAEPKVNLIDGSTWAAPQEKVIDYNPETKRYDPSLICQARAAIEYSLYNETSILKHLDQLQAEYQNHPKGTEDYKARLHRYRNDHYNFMSVVNWDRAPYKVPGVFKYKPLYEAQSTGRVSLKYGGFQSCSKRMKHAAFDIPGVRNYDIKTAQGYILHDELRSAGIACPWLDKFLNNPELKEQYIGSIGIDDDTWKRCFYGTVYGSVPSNRKGKIYSHLLEYFGTEEEAQAAQLKFKTIIDPLFSKISAYGRHLIKLPDVWKTVPNKRTTKEKSSGKVFTVCHFFKNSVGMQFQLEHATNGKDKQRRRLVAHVIQGKEAYFIHTLTTLGKKHGFQPLQNEHDGLVVLGEISGKAIEEAKELTGLNYLKLEQKPFVK
jgi:hypothetical protein